MIHLRNNKTIHSLKLLLTSSIFIITANNNNNNNLIWIKIKHMCSKRSVCAMYFTFINSIFLLSNASLVIRKLLVIGTPFCLDFCCYCQSCHLVLFLRTTEDFRPIRDWNWTHVCKQIYQQKYNCGLLPLTSVTLFICQWRFLSAWHTFAQLLPVTPLYLEPTTYLRAFYLDTFKWGILLHCFICAFKAFKLAVHIANF